MLVQELFAKVEEAVKVSILLTFPTDVPVEFKGLSDEAKSEKIFEEFVENQDILTIEDVIVTGSKIKLVPHLTEMLPGGAVTELQKKLQAAFDLWISNLAD